jgi:hypothetical protein
MTINTGVRGLVGQAECGRREGQEPGEHIIDFPLLQ